MLYRSISNAVGTLRAGSLADSNWLSEARVDGTRDYRSSTDLDFHRDIDPTVLQGLSDTGSDSVDISPIVLEATRL